MADLTKMAASEIVEEHKTEAHAPYLLVWGALAILTAIEYFYALVFKEVFLILLLGLLVWALIKAGLVGWFFMHLKFEGNWVYIMIIPAFVLATIFVLALMPDMVLKQNADEALPPEESSFIVPARELPGASPFMPRGFVARSFEPLLTARPFAPQVLEVCHASFPLAERGSGS
jgi:cytochrome c oxidase subunit 4